MYPFLRRYAVLGLLLLVVVGGVGLRWCLAQPQPTPLAARGLPPVQFEDTGTVRLNATGLSHAYGTITQPTTFAKPVGNATDFQMFRLQVCSAQPQPVTWDPAAFGTIFRVPLPTMTGGNQTCELWGLMFYGGQWQFMATTPPVVQEQR